MINYILGFIAGVCSFKIYQTIRIYRINKRCKHYSYVVNKPDDIRKSVKRNIR